MAATLTFSYRVDEANTGSRLYTRGLVRHADLCSFLDVAGLQHKDFFKNKTILHVALKPVLTPWVDQWSVLIGNRWFTVA